MQGGGCRGWAQRKGRGRLKWGLVTTSVGSDGMMNGVDVSDSRCERRLGEYKARHRHTWVWVGDRGALSHVLFTVPDLTRPSCTFYMLAVMACPA
jgi:hypothetical protein